MKPVTKTQIGVIAGSIVLIVLLLFANTTIPKKEEAKMSEHSTPNSAGILTLIENAKAKLSASQKKEVEMMEEAVKSSPDKKTAFENIINHNGFYELLCLLPPNSSLPLRRGGLGGVNFLS